MSIWTALSNQEQEIPDVNRGTWNKILAFTSMIQQYSNQLMTVNAYDLANLITQTSGIINDLKADKSIENLSRIENVEELLTSIRDAVEQQEEGNYTLDQYLENVSLLTDQDEETEEDRNKVTLMTVHSAKGLEFKHVYIVGMEEMLFPNQMSMGSQSELEEERRLFYVAVTRARKQATLTYALNRYRWGTPIDCTPSRFISEIDPQYLNYPEDTIAEATTPRSSTRPSKPFQYKDRTKPKEPVQQQDRYTPPKPVITSVMNKKPVISDPNFKPDDPRLLQVGQTVQHQSFGEGTITAMEGNMPDTKATVLFATAGEKKLLLKFARLKIVQ